MSRNALDMAVDHRFCLYQLNESCVEMDRVRRIQNTKPLHLLIKSMHYIIYA